MAGEIATAYVALVPTMSGFGAKAAAQLGPQVGALGTNAGRQAGAAFTTAASKESSNWFSQTAKNAIKNVTLYGSMYVAISKAQQGLKAMFDSMIGFNAELEQASIGFETMLGSAQAAKDQLQWIKDFARTTPFQYEDLVAYSQQLLALGFDAEMAKEVLESTGDAAAALGRGSESIARINLALGQMWTKGKVQSQEMLQLTEAGIGAWQILAEAYGTTVEAVQEAVTAGQVKAADAVPALLAGMNARFGGLMAKQSQTYSGILSNIQDTLQQQLAEAGEPLFNELKAGAQRFLDALSSPEAQKMLTDLVNKIAAAARALGDAVEIAWKFRNVLLEIGAAVLLSKLLSSSHVLGVGSLLSPATWINAAKAQRTFIVSSAGVATITNQSMAALNARVLGQLRGAAKIGGLMGVVDGYQRLSDAGADATKKAWGFAEAIGGGAIAGAAFGGAAGAAVGAVVGLAAGIFSMNAAAKAANNDLSIATDALTKMGVEANLANLALSGVTDTQLEAAGGFDKFINAMKSGNYDEFVKNLEKQRDAARELIEELEGTPEVNLGADFDLEKWESLKAARETLKELDPLLEALGVNSDAFAAAQEQVVASAYQAAFAADMQTGSLGKMTEAAWAAVEAEGGLSAQALAATLRMEGLAGVAGYATQMIASIPKGTAINFSTNASDIANQIASLVAIQQAAYAGSSTGIGPITQGIDAQIRALKKKLADALTSPVKTMSLPTSGSKLAKAASSVANEAARQLEQDRAAQIRFGDAFGTIMEAALSGDFERYRERLQEQVVSLTRDGYKKAADILSQQSAALTQAAGDYAALTSKLKTASSAYDDITGKMRDQYAASRDLIAGLGQAVDAQSFDQLAYLLGETTSRATEYQDVLKQLKEQGLSEDLWNQIAQAGPESMGLAQSILAQGQSGIEQLNSLSGGLVDAANSMGELVAQSMYQQGVDAMKAYIDGLKSESTALENQLETIANNVLTKTAGAITPGNAGYSPISAAPQQLTYQFGDITFDASKLQDLESIQAFITLLEGAATTQLVNQAGTVTS